MTAYTAKVTREGRWWSIYVPEIDYHTQARKLGEVDTMARDLIETMTDDTDIALAIRVDIPTEIADEWREADAQDDEARRVAKSAASIRRHAVTRLRATGVSADDAAEVLGISRARVYQLDQTRQPA